MNIIGGILIGYFQRELSMAEALQSYTVLSIGDGLVSQIPAIIISIAAGILVTRSSDEANLGEFVGKQLTIYPRAIAISGFLLLLFSIFLSETFWPFFLLSISCFSLAYFLKNKASGVSEMEELTSSSGKGGDLLDRITGARTNFAKEMGMLLPTIGVRDNIELEPNEYRFLLRGKEIARSSVMPDRFLAMNMGGGNEDKIDGVATIEPVFGIKALWVTEKDKRKAEVEGFTVVDPSSVLVTHLSDILKKSAFMILEREGTQKLVDLLKDNNPTLVSELLPDLVSVGIIQRTLQNLLRERIPIKNLTLILETIADMAPITKNPDDLSEQARKRLGMYFVKEFEVEPNKLVSMTLDPKLEQILVQRVKKSQFDVGLAMDADLTQGLISEIVPKIEEMSDQGLSPCMVTTSDLRLALRRFLEPSYPHLSIFAYQEIPPETMVEPFASITLPQFSIPENFSSPSGEAEKNPDLALTEPQLVN